ncbi:MAG: orotidine-5'-phosphate decarboxylase [Chloroflexi bacterium]|nr:orotidine-5'-phosphate decarboxylase [Chloroflexota bacterium]
MAFVEKLSAAAERNRSLLCVGLDPDPALMPVSEVAAFNRAIIDATADLVCAYKPNLGFYEGLGPAGMEALRRTLEAIPPHIPVIGDAKRGDVQPTARFYARALFEVWGFDAVTVNPFAGRDSVEPFLVYKDKGVLVWCRSSNPGAREFQDLVVTSGYEREARPLYEWVALRAAAWNDHGNVGLVVGATYPEELERVRGLCPDMPLLVPGVGAQAGGLGLAVRNGMDAGGRALIINASRGILYAGKDPATYPQAARREALSMREQINRELERLGKGWGI